MTLFQALAKSEELNCAIVNRGMGLKLKHPEELRDLDGLARDGWELDDTPAPIGFETVYLGSDIMYDIHGKPLGTVYSFSGSNVSNMPVGTKMKVTLEPYS